MFQPLLPGIGSQCGIALQRPILRRPAGFTAEFPGTCPVPVPLAQNFTLNEDTSFGRPKQLKQVLPYCYEYFLTFDSGRQPSKESINNVSAYSPFLEILHALGARDTVATATVFRPGNF